MIHELEQRSGMIITRDYQFPEALAIIEGNNPGWVAVTTAFLGECIKKHLRPHWDCMAENTASSRLAEKLGFTQSHEYTLYSFRL